MSPDAAMKIPQRKRAPGFTPRSALTEAPPAAPAAATQAPAGPEAAEDLPAPVRPPDQAAKTARVTRATPDPSSRERPATGDARRKPTVRKDVFNARLRISELDFLREEPGRLAEQHGVDTNMTELMNALIYGVRCGKVDLPDLLRDWRRDLHGF